LSFIFAIGCTNNRGKPVERIKTADSTQYAALIAEDELVVNIRNFLINDYLKNDLEYLPESDRKFQFYKIDLNDDGSSETFVRFMTSYFCGSGGCTFLLLDNNEEIITRFSVTRAPIFIEKTKRNGWAVLLVKDAGIFKELVYENGTYPSNPSLLPKAPYDKSSGHAEVLFDESNSNIKTYEF